MKNILLIGGAGYIGTVITSFFLKKNYNVKVLDNLIYDNSFSIQSFKKHSNFTFINGDLSDYKKLELASKNVDYVVLLAGLVGDPITKKYPLESEFINDKYLKKFIDFFDNKDILNLIFISTCSNYGLIKDDEVADEDFELKPLSLYAKAKVLIENYLINKKNKVNYSATILRFATAFGLSPRMRFDLTINQFTIELFLKKELVVFDENTWRPYCHVNDFAKLIYNVINTKKDNIHFQIFNAGGNKNNYTKKMIIDYITSKIKNTNIIYNQNDSDPRNYKVSFDKVKDVLGFEPEFSVEMGIVELIEKLKNNSFSNYLNQNHIYGNYKINYKIKE